MTKRIIILNTRWISMALLILLVGCRSLQKQTDIGPFGRDLAFLKTYTDVIVLEDRNSRARVAVIPGMQARVMTSSADGDQGSSFGWINRELITRMERQNHINVFGGEDRFWLGPEGGQFSVFFEKGAPFDLEHWQTPEPIDWGAWKVVKKERGQARFRKTMSLTNYSGTRFDLIADRTVKVLNRQEIEGWLGLKLGTDVHVAAFESDNRITNTGKEKWKKSTGLLSIWILGMFNPSPALTIVIPFREGPADRLGNIINDAYFGKVPENRLKIEKEIIFFKGDGQYRSKIGVAPARAKGIMGSYDGDQHVLTLVQFSLPDNTVDYVNSMWEIQDAPYRGDVINSYNDGPPSPGKKPLGPFYELESSSPSADLAPGESIRHVHRTFHFQAPEQELDGIARATLGIDLERIRSAFEPLREKQDDDGSTEATSD